MNVREKTDLRETSEVRDGMQIDWDLPITMDDGVVVRADVYRPTKPGKYPVIITYGPYAKWLAFQDGYKTAWDIMVEEHPDVPAGSTNKYQSWETVDPEKWVPDGYAVVRVDSRGSGRSPGYVDHFSPRETKDFHDCIEWAAVQPWSNGKVGANGISYYAINQWQVAALAPPHLKAMCVWEGAGDWYRDKNHQGGIVCTFQANWYDMQSVSVQHGLGTNGPKSNINGDWVCGPDTLSDAELRKNRSDFGQMIFDHPLDDQYHRDRSAHWDKIKIPFLSAGNWGGNSLHLRGNVEGFVRAASEQKWLEMHGSRHWTLFYADYGVELQKRFFGHFLKGEDTGWDKQPKVQLNIRHPGEKFVIRHENEWPLARTQWTKLYLNFARQSLDWTPPEGGVNEVSFPASGDGLMFRTKPFAHDTEITGPSAAKLFLSSSTDDADVFLVLQVFDPEGHEVVFKGALDPHTPIAQGWLRASHRKLDKALSTEYRPYHTHDEKQPLTPGEAAELDVEIWPTCIVIPKGYTLALSVRSKDYVYTGGSGGRLSNMKNEFTGCGPFLHNDPRDRTPNITGAELTLRGGKGENYILVPIIPEKA
ncbi:CocE/NonD family hydrolase [Aquabacter sp. CN5-332]|uniref:CocE/NonD family hydrolase n=1 Tax=Aquabacter sp. CN5-332 TaxID=3156608 RepID=UPI0032B5D81C